MESTEFQELLQEQLGQLIDVIEVHDEIDSTNSEAMRILGNGDASSRLIVARSQTAGRGRRGRQWISPRDSGIYMSLVRPVDIDAQSVAGLSLVTALSVWQTLASLDIEGIELKWPNDVLHRGSKLAGILLETRQLPERVAVIFGIGINLSFTDSERAQVDREMVSLDMLSPAPVARVELVTRLVSDLYTAVEQYLDCGFEFFQPAWNEADPYLDKDVVVDSGSTQLIGKHRGVDKDGALLIDTTSGRQRISGGEVFPSLGLV